MEKEEINKLFRELESNAYDVTYHKYYFKEANQIIREHFNQLKSENEALKKRVEELENLCSEAMGEQSKNWRDRFRQLLTNK